MVLRDRAKVNMENEKTEKKSFKAAKIILLALAACAAAIFGLSINRYLNEPSNIGTEIKGEALEELRENNSPLISYAYISPNATFPRSSAIDKITIHHVSADLSLKQIGEVFAKRDRMSSENYAIDSSGNIGLFVEEENAAWTSSNAPNDERAVTIEVANSETGGEWAVSDKAYDALIELVADICYRNGIEELTFTGDESGSLTLHNMFRATDCPGPYLLSRIDDIVIKVNAKLNELRGE